MKKIIALALSAVMVASFAGCGSSESSKGKETSAESATEAQETQATQETFAADLKARLDEALKTKSFSGVVQITKGGEPVYQYVSGNDENGKPLTIDASLPLASTSKQFCAAAIMLLCEQNKLSVDDTLDRYFPEYKEGKKITVKQLLTMSSGIPSYYMDFLDPSTLGSNEAENVRKIKEAVFEMELHFEPGEDYEYSNSNFFLLADIVEQLGRVSYHEFLRKSFFEPLGMTHTGFLEEIPDNPDWAAAMSKTELLNETTAPGLAKGAGDIVSNAEDMDKWMRGLSGGEIISSESFRQMRENINPYSVEDYCYGLWHMPYDGVGHVGQIEPHFGAVDYLNPERDVYLFAASNDGRGMSYVQELPQALLSILFENGQ